MYQNKQTNKQKKLKGQCLKVGFFQKVMAKCSNLSNRHACEPKIVPELLFPVLIVNEEIVLF